MVQGPGGSSAYGPVNQQELVGVVKYVSDGAEFVLRARREDAYKQMYSACRGRYFIDSESQHAGGAMTTAIGNSVFVGNVNYTYIRFSCVLSDQLQPGEREIVSK